MRDSLFWDSKRSWLFLSTIEVSLSIGTVKKLVLVSIEKLPHSVVTVKELSFCMSAAEEMSNSQCYSGEVIKYLSGSKR